MRDSEKTFRWIVGVLRKNRVSFVIAGGLAARSYGSQRPLNDIDLCIHDADMEKIVEDVRPYITFGPARSRNERWDCLALTLNHEGQEVDITGDDTTRLCDARTGVWADNRTDFSRTEEREIFGLRVPVVSREELIAYKAMLEGEHQKTDIQALSESMHS